jgi:hypothetical protein
MLKKRASKSLDIEDYLTAARIHGEDSEPDHEVGDLQDLLRTMWSMLTPEQRHTFAEQPKVHETLRGALTVDEDEKITTRLVLAHLKDR